MYIIMCIIYLPSKKYNIHFRDHYHAHCRPPNILSAHVSTQLCSRKYAHIFCKVTAR